MMLFAKHHQRTLAAATTGL